MSDDLLQNSHEERIQKLEGLTASVAKLEANDAHIIEKLDYGFKTLAEGQVELNNKVKPVLERHEKSKARRELAKKFIFPAIAAAAGVFGSKFGAQILALIGF